MEATDWHFPVKDRSRFTLTVLPDSMAEHRSLSSSSRDCTIVMIRTLEDSMDSLAPIHEIESPS